MTTSNIRYATKSDLKAIAVAASERYANQDAFSKVQVGNTAIEADSASDTLNIIAGSNVTLTPNAGTDTLTIAATDTKYTASSTSPSMDGTAAAGSSTDYARADHVHPTDTSRAAASHSHAASDITSGMLDVARIPTGSTGTTVALGNHTHSEYQSQHTTTTASLTVNGWSSNSQTVSAAGVTASNTVIVAPAPASATAYAAAGIICTAQGSGTLTFTCTTTPSDAITVNVLVLGGGITPYSITNDSPSAMSVDKTSAQAGETVTVTNLTNSALSWELDGVSQTDIAANGTATFTMPSNNVVVTEHVVATYSIRCVFGNQVPHRGWVKSPTSPTEGDTVTITPPDYSTYSYMVRSDDGEHTIVSSGNSAQGFTFVMPGYDVRIDIYVYEGGGNTN